MHEGKEDEENEYVIIILQNENKNLSISKIIKKIEENKKDNTKSKEFSESFKSKKNIFDKNNIEQKKKEEKPKIVPKQLNNSKVSIFSSKDKNKEKKLG